MSASPPPASTAAPRAPSLLDRLSTAMMVLAGLALFIMCLSVCWEVASRYLLGHPTIWVWDVNVQLMMFMIMFGMSEVYRRDAYVRVDVLTMRLSPRRQKLLDVIFAPVILFVAGIIVWMGWHYFAASYARNQAASTTFAPLLWPVKFTIPLGALILGAQVVQKCIFDIRDLRAGHAPQDAART